MDTGTCEKCGREYSIGDWPFCPHGKSQLQVIGDDIPGGVWIRHGICNEDGTPRKYYSKGEIREAAFKKGLSHVDVTPKINQQIVEATQKADEERAKR